MSLSAMIRKFQPGNLATATVATVATVHPKTLSSVADVAGVAVANAKIVKREGRKFRSRAPRPKVVTVLPKSEISANPLFNAELVHNADPDTQHRLENQHLSLPGRSEGYCSSYNINLSAMIRKRQYGNLATATVATFATAPTNTPPTDSTATAAMAKVVTAYSSEFQSLAPCPGDVTVLPKMEKSASPLSSFQVNSELVRNAIPDTRFCQDCQHLALPGRSEGYCGGRDDLPLAYGTNHPLRKLPADHGVSCDQWQATQ